jgi:hypothetical protein
MNQLLPLLLIGGAAYFLWPQIQSMLHGTAPTTSAGPTPAPLTSNASMIPGGSAPVVTTTPMQTQVVQTPVPSPPAAPVYVSTPSWSTYSPIAPPTYTAPAAPIEVSTAATANLLANRYSIQQLHDMLLGIEGPYYLMSPEGWNGLLEQQTGIHIPTGGPNTGSNVMLDGQWNMAYWPWASQQLQAMGFSGLSGLSGWEV